MYFQFGILPVVAIGNDNHGNSSSPGNTAHAFSVGAVEKVRGGKLEVAFFSSGASLVFPGDEDCQVITKPDVVAPGVQVFSCIPPEKRPDGVYEYSYMNGTSMATPHVAGVLRSAVNSVSGWNGSNHAIKCARSSSYALKVMVWAAGAVHHGLSDRPPPIRSRNRLKQHCRRSIKS